MQLAQQQPDLLDLEQQTPGLAPYRFLQPAPEEIGVDEPARVLAPFLDQVEGTLRGGIGEVRRIRCKDGRAGQPAPHTREDGMEQALAPPVVVVFRPHVASSWPRVCRTGGERSRQRGRETSTALLQSLAQPLQCVVDAAPDVKP